MSLNEFILAPRNPTEAIYQRYFALVRAYGACIYHSTLRGLPATLTQQYNSNEMIIAYDTIVEAGEYNIWEFPRHSTFLIAVYSWPGMPEDAEIALFVTLKALTAPPPKVHVFVGIELEEEYEIKDGERSFVVEFDRPTTGKWVNIIIRPITSVIL